MRGMVGGTISQAAGTQGVRREVGNRSPGELQLWLLLPW